MTIITQNAAPRTNSGKVFTLEECKRALEQKAALEAFNFAAELSLLRHLLEQLCIDSITIGIEVNQDEDVPRVIEEIDTITFDEDKLANKTFEDLQTALLNFGIEPIPGYHNITDKQSMIDYLESPDFFCDQINDCYNFNFRYMTKQMGISAPHLREMTVGCIRGLEESTLAYL